MLATIKKKPREERALILREAAVKLAHAYGRIFELQGKTMTFVCGRIFQIQYRDPTHKGWKEPPHVEKECRELGITFKDWSFYVKVMTEHEKMPGRKITVMSMDWDEEGNFKVCQFRSGEWEALLQKFADDLPAPTVLH